jgi:quercetin dioxygenase-like cupin family protein
MHLAQADLRSVRQDGMSVDFAILGPVAYVQADLPATGSVGTSVEQPCERPHWGFVIEGDVWVRQGRRKTRIAPGHAFHVPGGQPAHRFEAGPHARIAGFEPIDPGVDASDDALRALGFEPVARGERPAVVPGSVPGSVATGGVDAEFHRMSSLVMARARLGTTSGYTSELCDLPHWGSVIAGSVTIEWETDVELLGTGDIFYCPPGPPGHRVLAADPATILDFTPVSAIEASARMTAWRRGMLELVRRPQGASLEPAVAALI